MNLILVLASLAIFIAQVENAPLHSLEEQGDSPICIMWVMRPFKFEQIPCHAENDPVYQIYKSVVGKIIKEHLDKYLPGVLALLRSFSSNNLPSSHLPWKRGLNEYRRQQDENENSAENDETDEEEAENNEDDETDNEDDQTENETDNEDDQTDNENDESDVVDDEEGDQDVANDEEVNDDDAEIADFPVQSGRRTFGMVIPMAEMAIKALGGDFGLNIPTSTDIEFERQSKAREEEVSQFRMAQDRATLEALETKEYIARLEAQSEEAAKERKDEIANLKSLITSLKNSQEKEQMEKGYRQLLQEKDSAALQREIDHMKQKLEFEELLKKKKLEDLAAQVEIEKTVEDHQHLVDLEDMQRTGGKKRDSKCAICGL